MIELVDIMDDLIVLMEDQLANDTANNKDLNAFSLDIYDSYDKLLDSVLTWKEISVNNTRYSTSSNILDQVNMISYLNLDIFNESQCLTGRIQPFDYTHVRKLFLLLIT